MAEQSTDPTSSCSICGSSFWLYLFAAALLWIAFEHGIHAAQGHSLKHAIQAAFCVGAAAFFLRQAIKKCCSSKT